MMRATYRHPLWAACFAWLAGCGSEAMPELPRCADLECHIQADCDDSDAKPACACRPGWTGDGITCTDIDECAEGTAGCDAAATCDNLPGAFACTCPSGMRGDGVSCTYIDECAEGLHDCDPIADCVDTSGGYTCICPEGTRGDTVCLDIDECAEGLHDCDPLAHCDNLDGSYSCTCPAGTRGDGTTCTDIDECAEGLDDCLPIADCIDVAGAYECACPDGYQGDGQLTCENVDECALGLDGCDPLAACVDLGGHYRCDCPPGYADPAGDGSVCEEIDECQQGLDDCDPVAECENLPGAWACVCPDGYIDVWGDGTACDIDECADGLDDCGPDEHCLNQVPGWQCVPIPPGHPLPAYGSLADADARLLGQGENAVGRSVAGAGDLNGDGVADLLLGVRSFADQPLSSAGGVYLVRGPAPLGDTDLAAESWGRLLGEFQGDLAGRSVSAAGDANGDGIGDVLVGAPNNDVGGYLAGAAYLVHGPIPGGDIPLADASLRLRGFTADLAGTSVSDAGDMNGDGFDDIIIGAPWNAGGAAFVVLGPTSGEADLDSADLRLVGEADGDFAGHSVSGAGDVNGDGLSDVIIGAHDNDTAGDSAGAAYLVYGPRLGDLILDEADGRLLGELAGHDAGTVVSHAGDVNGDGLDDVLVGAPGREMDRGAAYLVHGPITGDLVLDGAAAILRGQPEEWVGSNSQGITGAGDLHADGFDDILVGVPRSGAGGHDAGAAYLLYGPVAGVLALVDADATLVGEANNDWAGRSVSGAGDLNADGYADFLIGALYDADFYIREGKAHLIYGGI